MKKIPKPLVDMLERAAKSGLQQFLLIAYASLPGVLVISRIPWYAAVGTGLFAALLSLGTSLLSWKMPVLPFWADLAARMAKTFIQSVLATLGANVVNVFEVSWAHVLSIGLGAMFLSLITSLLSAGIDNAGPVGPSASLAYANPYEEAAATNKPVMVSDDRHEAPLAVDDPTYGSPPVG